MQFGVPLVLIFMEKTLNTAEQGPSLSHVMCMSVFMCLDEEAGRKVCCVYHGWLVVLVRPTRRHSFASSWYGSSGLRLAAVLG